MIETCRIEGRSKRDMERERDREGESEKERSPQETERKRRKYGEIQGIYERVLERERSRERERERETVLVYLGGEGRDEEIQVFRRGRQKKEKREFYRDQQQCSIYWRGRSED